MKTKELIAKLKKCPEEANVFFYDPHSNHNPVEDLKVISADKSKALGIKSDDSVVLLSD
jgi:hypothetical protein